MTFNNVFSISLDLSRDVLSSSLLLGMNGTLENPSDDGISFFLINWSASFEN